MKRSDALPSASRSLQAEVGVTEFSAVPAYTPIDKIKRALRRARLQGADQTMSRPSEVLNAFGRAHFGAWKALDRLRAARHREWPPYVFAPLDIAGLAIIEALRETRQPLPKAAWEIIGPASELAGLAAWRITQQVYRFDPDLYAALLATPITGEIPGEHFRRLPAWCVYVETPGLTAPLVGGGDEPLHGVFAWLDWRKDRGEDILTLGLDTDAQLAVGHVPLVGTLEARARPGRSGLAGGGRSRYLRWGATRRLRASGEARLRAHSIPATVPLRRGRRLCASRLAHPEADQAGLAPVPRGSADSLGRGRAHRRGPAAIRAGQGCASVADGQRARLPASPSEIRSLALVLARPLGGRALTGGPVAATDPGQRR